MEFTVEVTTVGLVVTAVEESDMVSVVAVRLVAKNVLPSVVVEVTAVDIETVSTLLKVEAVLFVIICVAVVLISVETVP